MHNPLQKLEDKLVTGQRAEVYAKTRQHFKHARDWISKQSPALQERLLRENRLQFEHFDEVEANTKEALAKEEPSTFEKVVDTATLLVNPIAYAAGRLGKKTTKEFVRGVNQRTGKETADDPGVVNALCLDVSVVERSLEPYGYLKLQDGLVCLGATQMLNPVLGSAGEAIEDWCLEHPDSYGCKATSPKGDREGLSKCDRFGVPKVLCEPWFWWITGSGVVATFGFIAYATYRTSPLGLALGSYMPAGSAGQPGLPSAQATVAQATSTQKLEQAVDEELARRKM